MNINNKWMAKKIKECVDWVVEQDCGCANIYLDDVLSVCVGWSSGYDDDDPYCIHSKSEPYYGVNVGIKVYTSDYLGTDFDWFSNPWYESGDVWDTNTTISENTNYEEIADYMLKEYYEMSKYNIEENGLITGLLDEEEIA